MKKGITLKASILALSILGCAAPAQAQIFGSTEIESSDVSDFKKWEGVLKRQDAAVDEMGPEMIAWQDEIQQFSGITDDKEMLDKVNTYINTKIHYRSDRKVWGKNDYWASPVEAFSKGFGDCEDYAIAKYFTLKALGFSEDNMRIVILRDLNKGEIHAVLAVNENGSNYILDNQSAMVKQDTDIAYYSPIYSINSHNWWRNT